MEKSEKEIPVIYPEQYELFERGQLRGPISRRSFFKRMGAGMAAFVVVSDVLSAQAFKHLSPKEKALAEDTIASWIHIGADESITVYTGKVEVGQNIRTSLAQTVAEELSVPVKDITLIMGDTDSVPYDRGTFGSLTTPQMAPILRKAAASIREMMVELASKEWNLGKETSLHMEKGYIHHPSNGAKLSYAQLANGEKLFHKINNDAKTVPPKEWKIAGTSVPKVNGRDIITGRHQYVSDMSLPGMVYGKILRPPTYGATLENINTAKAEQVPGVKVVREKDFVGVTAPDSRTASMALAMIETEWKEMPQPSRNVLFSHLKEKGEKDESEREALLQAYSSAEDKLEQEFLIHYIAHVPLEPRAGIAKWEGDQLTVWTGTQRPFGVQEELQKTFNIPKDNIRVLMPDTGSGYGGKHTGEAGIEAARLSKAVGKPVKVNWTREEEFKWAYFRPAGVITVKSATRNGALAAWEFHNYNSGSAGLQTPYEAMEKHHKFHSSDSPLRQGSYRALASTANIFAIESQMHDMAVLNNTDPLEFRLRHLKDDRLTAVVKEAAKAFDWGKKKPTDHGYGIACGAVKGGFVATCAEVHVHPSSHEVKILRTVTAFECGAIINPRHLRSQVLGCVLQGLGGALFEAVDFRDGDILNPSLSAYRVPRFKDTPEMEIVLLDRKDLASSGAGEAPIVGIAPAIRNAIFDATGIKINQLPLLPSGVVPGMA
ncbi:xanthine dehydrogenase family protein molybdopterin-binding subunit [Negadavirga shengliensis]|uniref:Molybdopterin cofactor-binding domain-containing protein n=1 Tax=Negadavirga shengliensis TaxID=1389218 RepID=A0ABV9SUU5_9BACT